MKIIMTILSFFILTSLFSQKMEKTEKLLDSLNIDFNLTPNQIIKNNLFGTNIVWAGKLESIDISNMKDSLQIFFYCRHFNFDTVSKRLIIDKQMKLKDKGSGSFIVSIISSEMTMKDANELKKTFERQAPYLLTIGKAVDIEKKFKKNYVNTFSYTFYTFRK